MKYGLFILMAVALAILQVSLCDYLMIFGAKPDLLLIAAVWASLYFDLPRALAYVIFIALLKDTFSPASFGINTFLFPLWSILTISLSKKIIIEQDYIYAALVFIVAALQGIASRILLAFLGSFLPFWPWLRIYFWGILYTALLTIPLIRLMKKLFPKES